MFKPKECTRGLDQDPVAAKYLCRFVGATEIINNLERWCLWLEDLDRTDLKHHLQFQRYSTPLALNERRTALTEAVAGMRGLFAGDAGD